MFESVDPEEADPLDRDVRQHHTPASWCIYVLQTCFYFCTAFQLLFRTSIFYQHLWRQIWLFSFTIENISPQIQVWKTTMARTELCSAWLSFDLIIECTWNIQSDSWILSRNTARCLTWRVMIHPRGCPLSLSYMSTRHNFMLEPKTKTLTV